jgi:hypothetical protein
MCHMTGLLFRKHIFLLSDTRVQRKEPKQGAAAGTRKREEEQKHPIQLMVRTCMARGRRIPDTCASAPLARSEL